MKQYKIRDKNIAEQVASIKIKYPHFKTTMDHLCLKTTGELQPTSRSDKYLIQIKYSLKELPKIEVLKPALIVNYKSESIPHVYPGNRLCLFRPSYKEFTATKLISETIIPWTSLWLYHYEIWHITGDWLGGGEHPEIKSNYEKKK